MIGYSSKEMIEMSIYKDLEEAVNYIEKNIRDKILLDDIAAYLYISKYHLHRVFKLVTKQKLMEYVRMRKLSLSLNDLLYTDLKINDIAAEFGFEHEQSYNRSFKKAFGISPSQFRFNKQEVPIVDKIDFNSIMDLEVGIILSPSFVIKPEFYLVGIKHSFLVDENYRTNLANRLAKDFFYNHRKRIHNAIHPNILISFSSYKDITTNHSLYLPAIEVKDLNFIPEGMSGIKINTHKYSVFKYVGSHSGNDITLKTLYDIYQYIYSWLLHSQYIQDGSFHFELINSSISKDDYCESDIYLPVKIKE
jgi:AraC family transcriptional regulator